MPRRSCKGRGATANLATRYVAGRSPEDGIGRAEDLLARRGIRGSLFYLGEYVDTAELVAENVANKLAVAEALGRTDLDVHVSIDPTQVGHGLDSALARENVHRIAQAITQAAGDRPGVHCAMLDMEDQTVTDFTIALHDDLKKQGLPMALTLQAYLRRTETDLQAQIAAGSRVRLVNGALAAGPDVAFARRADVKRNYRRLIAAMFSPEARGSGFYPIVATHDDKLHDHAIHCADANGWPPDSYEFEMLLGVRGDVAEALARQGRRVRLYLPFGRDWWPYAVRRIGENPRNAWLLARSVVAAP